MINKTNKKKNKNADPFRADILLIQLFPIHASRARGKGTLRKWRQRVMGMFMNDSKPPIKGLHCRNNEQFSAHQFFHNCGEVVVPTTLKHSNLREHTRVAFLFVRPSL